MGFNSNSYWRPRVLFANIIFVVIVLFLQFMFFAFLPAVDVRMQNPKAEASHAVIQKSYLLILEILIGIAILFLINRRLFKIDKKSSFVISGVEAVVLLLTLLAFSMNYVNKF